MKDGEKNRSEISGPNKWHSCEFHGCLLVCFQSWWAQQHANTNSGGRNISKKQYLLSLAKGPEEGQLRKLVDSNYFLLVKKLRKICASPNSCSRNKERSLDLHSYEAVRKNLNMPARAVSVKRNQEKARTTRPAGWSPGFLHSITTEQGANLDFCPHSK